MVVQADQHENGAHSASLSEKLVTDDDPKFDGLISSSNWKISPDQTQTEHDDKAAVDGNDAAKASPESDKEQTPIELFVNQPE